MSEFNERFQLYLPDGLATRQALVAKLASGAEVDRRILADLVLTTIPRIRRGNTGGGSVATRWVLHGHTGPYFDGSPPTGRTLTLPGASFTQVEGGKIHYERVYTDRQTVTEQLGFTPKKT